MFGIFRRRGSNADWDLERLSDEQLGMLPLHELQRICNKRWAYGKRELQQRAQEELMRRSPRKDWTCNRCGRPHYHEKEIRVAGSFAESFLGWERNKFHAIVCNYCGNTEIYSVLMPGAEQGFGLFGS